MGGNLLDLPHQQWLPRRRTLQPLFTKQRVGRYAGHMAAAAHTVVDGWSAGATVDLDTECRALTLRALGRSVFGLDLDTSVDTSGRAAYGVSWVADPGLRPVNLPHWLPTSGQRRARRATARLHRLAAEILAAVRADPDRDAPLVRALITAADPQTGRPLSDDRDLRRVGVVHAGRPRHHVDHSHLLIVDVGAIAQPSRTGCSMRSTALGDRPLTPDDVPGLGYTVRVLHEALRLCPPVAVTGRRLKMGISPSTATGWKPAPWR